MAAGAPGLREPAYAVSRSFGAVATAGLAALAHAVPAAFAIAAAALVVAIAAAALVLAIAAAALVAVAAAQQPAVR